MTEVEFLPSWYTSGKRRQFGYRTQYVALGGMLAVMVVWSLSAARSISYARADINDLAIAEASALAVTAQVASANTQLAALKARAAALQKIDSRIDVPAVLGELSYLIEHGIVLRRLELVGEKLRPDTPALPTTAVPAVRIARQGMPDAADQLPIGEVRFKVVISGLAGDSSDVAGLIVALEGSPYFNRVALSFSRTVLVGHRGSLESKSAANQTRQTPGPADAVAASEFEITCYLANCRID
ncbi:MAG TPA: hypothetical protein ENN81_09885 [Phycisphaerales bacterium]|mgnify:CR=1 FL=1|nr:hypothetical protein [Phycisphaerales bacterium]